MVPIPVVASFAELNRLLLEQCRQDEVRIVSGQPKSIAELFREEQPYLRSLPARPFECCVRREVRLNSYSQVVYETNRYSVPVELARRELVLKAYPFQIEILSEHQLIATHARCYVREQDIFDPLHYLALLEQRPGAFEHAKPLKGWRKQWPPVYQQMLVALKDKWSDGQGIREFVRILKLHQLQPAALVEQAVRQALSYGCIHFDGVQQCLNQLSEPVRQLSFLDLSDKPHLLSVGQQPLQLADYELLVDPRR